MARPARYQPDEVDLGREGPRFYDVCRLGKDRPFRAGRQRFTGAQKAGLAYEKRVGRQLARWLEEFPHTEFLEGEWFQYDDGRYAQVDKAIILPSNAVILFEVKLSWVDTREQLNFYADLFRALGHTTILRVTVCRNMRPGVDRSKIVRNLDDIFDTCVVQMRS